MAFRTEQELLQTFLWSASVQHPRVANPVMTYLEVEPKGLFGIPDLVISDLGNSPSGPNVVRTLAFEMKLSKWNRALMQAFRYRGFAHLSYVVLDRSHLRPALSNLHQFISVNVGLLSIDESGEIRSHFEPRHEVPFSEHLTKTLERRVSARFPASSNTLSCLPTIIPYSLYENFGRLCQMQSLAPVTQ